MGPRPMALSSGLVIPDRVHAHPLLSVLPPQKLRELRYVRSQELLFLAIGDRNRAVPFVMLHVLARSGVVRAADCTIVPLVALRCVRLR
jgi:hypothetical protein